jgi:hypothetical protein
VVGNIPRADTQHPLTRDRIGPNDHVAAAKVGRKNYRSGRKARWTERRDARAGCTSHLNPGANLSTESRAMSRKKPATSATPNATATSERSSQQLANLRSLTFLTSAEGSLYLRVSRRTLERWSARGTVNPIKLSSSKYVLRRESLDALVDAREVAA